PHAPVEARHVRFDKSRPPLRVARLPAEFPFLEILSVVTDLDDELGPLGCHDTEQAVAVDGTERLEPGKDTTRPRTRDLHTRSSGELNLADKRDRAQADDRHGCDTDRHSPRLRFGSRPIALGLRAQPP